jgi:hypothetical protein
VSGPRRRRLATVEAACQRKTPRSTGCESTDSPYRSRVRFDPKDEGGSLNPYGDTRQVSNTLWEDVTSREPAHKRLAFGRDNRGSFRQA